MKKNVMMRIAAVLLVCVLVTTCGISGTFAKYTSDIVGTDSARVAVWAFEFDGQKAVDNKFTFDLFATINEEDTTTTEGDVSDGLIAPGTGGSFVIKLKNTSEVTAKYKIEYTVTTNGIPLEFSLDGSTWKTDITQLNMQDYVNIAINTNASDVTVYWRWIFNGNDSTDTGLGVAGTAEATVTATVKVEQVN